MSMMCTVSGKRVPMLRLTEKDLPMTKADPTQWFDVTVTETLEQIVRVEAHSPEEAEQLVALDWQKREFVLDAENFACVEFVAVPVEDEQKI